ncbi:putative polysaccharide biosynthesis protein [Periweissella fabalis]|uniref:Polysaccharide biosynthesis protein n=1 Tax=Periweissella fabalis TaxID=1070421 RepID=A0A7X6S3X1_9LACO|nr:polysaccharide biosynthesis protein [Periweissella fabalis]MCM0599817.1 polysaccharide biosynthesis protein [Periweissella fabalis]NKZ24377.1 polysaccharide biosynthesis protein [Periweissella fabalis]
MGNNKLAQGTAILAVAALIAKVLSAVYRIPLENFVGDTGFYVYQQIYPIYGIGMILALNGLPNFISKLIVAETDEARDRLAGQLLRLLFVIACIIVILLNITAPALAKWMGDQQLTNVIRAVSLMFIMMPILAVGRGVAQGQLNMRPTAYSQVIEQLVRVVIIVVVAYQAMKIGMDVYLMGTLAMLSAPIASACASMFFIKSTIHYWRITRASKMDWGLLKKICSEGAIVCILAALLIILQLVDSFTIKNSLVSNGMTETAAKMAKGSYDRSQPLVQFGLVLATSFGTALVPQLRHAYLAGKWDSVATTGRSLLRLTVWLASAATVGMMCLMPQINYLLFGSMTSSNVLAVYVLSIISMSILILLTSILQSLDLTNFLSRGILVALISKIGLNLLLIKYIGLIGASWATIISLGLMLGYILISLPKRLQVIFLPWQLLVKIGLHLIIMAVLVKFITYEVTSLVGSSRIITILPIMLGSIVGVLVFVSLSIWQQTLTDSEWQLLPKGKFIIKLTKKLRKTNAIR